MGNADWRLNIYCFSYPLVCVIYSVDEAYDYLLSRLTKAPVDVYAEFDETDGEEHVIASPATTGSS